MKTELIKGKKISYTINRNGESVIIFLHGYLETKQVFTNFLENNLQQYTTLLIDIPGHGASEPLGEEQTVEQIARQIIALIDTLKIDSFVIYGHSMGGYIAQAIAKQIPDRVKLLGLLHSNVFVDNNEKKENRRREIELLKHGKLTTLVQTFMPKVVADFNYPQLKDTIAKWIETANTMKPEGIIASLHAMILRPDNTSMLEGETPIHLIAGNFDTFITPEAVGIMSKGKAVCKVSMIDNCGHASFIEQPEQLANEIQEIIKQNTSQ